MNRLRWLAVILLFVLIIMALAGCNYPTPEDSNGAEETSIALTVAADVAGEFQDDGEEPQDDGEENEPADEEEPAGEETPTETPEPTEEPEEEEDMAEGERADFIADVTIPDYSEIEIGEEITKTWRIKNAGSTTWTTSYVVEFEKGEKLGASTQIPLKKEVAPGETIDISIDFRVPTATGEYSSYWILKNEENRRLGTGEDGESFEMYMLILAVKDGDDGSSGGSSSGGESISGGAKITGATVSVDDANYQGECPAQLSFSYTVTTSNAGKVQFKLVYSVISPSGYSFDPPPQYLVDFTSGYTVYYDYLLFSNDPVTATVRVRAIGENDFLSAPIQFSVKCQ